METITNEKEQIEEIFTEEALHQRHVSDFIPQKLERYIMYRTVRWVYFRLESFE